MTIDNTRILTYAIGLKNRIEGQPVIIFENGLGETVDSWKEIIDGVSEIGPVLLYDRIGTGESGSDDLTPTVKYNAEKLKKILQELNIAPPYLLVGHSLGAIYIRGFANYFSEVLAGLIFVDPADFTQKMEDFAVPFKEIGVSQEYIDSMMDARLATESPIDSSRNIRIQQEYQMLKDLRNSDFQELVAKRLPEIPIHFIVGGRFSVPPQYRSEDYNQETLFRARTDHWIKNWIKVVNQSSYGRLFYSAKAGHYVQMDDPELLVTSIKLAISDYYRLKKDE